MDELEHQRHTALNREIYKKRKQTIERIFADAKEKHGMRWTKYRGLEKVATHTMLTFAAMNLKTSHMAMESKKPMAFYLKFLQRLTKRSWQLSHSFLSTV